MNSGDFVAAVTLSPSYRRLVTDRWGYVSFWASITLMVAIVFSNVVLWPALVALVNVRPSRFLKAVVNCRWKYVTMWVLTAALVVAAGVQTEGLDLVFVTKRLGRQIVALMPAMYFLTIKPSLLPQSFYLELITFHKFLSRVVVVFAVLHGIFYTVIYYQNATLFKLWKTANLLGIGALAVFLAMALLSLAPVRRRTYELFYQSHVIGAWICIPMIRYHSRPRCDLYMGMCAALLLYQVLARLWCTRSCKLRVQYVSPTLLLVTIPKEHLGYSRQFMSWRLASHLRLGGSILNPVNWVRSSHPYTIASLPEDGELKLVVRPGDYRIKMRQQYSIYGPHRSVPDYLLNQIHDLMIRRTLIVVGGAGIAFGAPMMRYLRLHGADVRMLWVMRDPYDARVLPQLGLNNEVAAGNIEIYYTGESLVNKDRHDMSGDENLTVGISDSTCDDHDYGFSTINSATRHPGLASRLVRGDKVLSEYASFMANTRPHLNLRLKSWLYGYSPDSDDCCCADRVIDSCAEDRLGSWVMACGSQPLCHTAEKWATDAGLSFFQDSFSL